MYHVKKLKEDSIIGRNVFLSENEQKRFDWRRRNFVVSSQHILIYTFDQLLAFLKNIPPHWIEDTLSKKFMLRQH